MSIDSLTDLSANYSDHSLDQLCSHQPSVKTFLIFAAHIFIFIYLTDSRKTQSSFVVANRIIIVLITQIQKCMQRDLNSQHLGCEKQSRAKSIDLSLNLWITVSK